MKTRIVNLLPVLLLFAFYLMTPVVTQAQVPPPPPPPANDYFPQKWKEFLSVEGKFKIRFPGIPKESSTERESNGIKLIVRSVNYKSFILYGVTYTDYPQNVDDPSIVKNFLDNVRNGGLSGIAETKPRIIKESNISVNGHPSRFLQVEMDGKAILRAKYVAFKNRLYIVGVTTPKGHQNALGAENDYEKIAMSFLDSFQIIE
jgi:hypothetical protein